jgi:hypothetical protein
MPQKASQNDIVLAESKKNQTVKKWAEPLSKMKEIPRHKLGILAMLLESQRNFMMENPGEVRSPGSRKLLTEEAVSTGDIADFTRFALPMIRKSYAKLIADDIVGVQPMSQPASLVFYLRYRYGTTK